MRQFYNDPNRLCLVGVSVGPPVIPVILPNGYIADTADVEAAKEHHFQLFNQAQEAAARAQERDGKKYAYTAASR